MLESFMQFSMVMLVNASHVSKMNFNQVILLWSIAPCAPRDRRLQEQATPRAKIALLVKQTRIQARIANTVQ